MCQPAPASKPNKPVEQRKQRGGGKCQSCDRHASCGFWWLSSRRNFVDNINEVRMSGIIATHRRADRSELCGKFRLHHFAALFDCTILVHFCACGGEHPVIHGKLGIDVASVKALLWRIPCHSTALEACYRLHHFGAREQKAKSFILTIGILAENEASTFISGWHIF